MTAQISDDFLFKGEEYDLIGIAGDNLFTPEQYGMKPWPIHTACYRGFSVCYEITDKGIYLSNLAIHEKNENYKPINGVIPEKGEYQASYKNVNLLIPFTGSIRLAKDFIRELYVHMGHQKPAAFKTVLDLQIKKGNIVEIIDRSKEMEAKRADFEKCYEDRSQGQQFMLGVNDALDMSLE